MPMVAKRLRLWGLFKSELAVEETKVLKHFIVVKQGRCLVGNSTATEPGILHMGPAPNPLAESCNTVSCPFVESLKAKFPGIFSVGRLKNYQLKLHIDPPVTPVVQKMRRIPFLGKDKVTAKVDELLENDIIERVERPTTSISPVVVAPKPSGDIRLCIDVRRANEAIVCERLPIHTVKEVLESPNGRKVFSKIGVGVFIRSNWKPTRYYFFCYWWCNIPIQAIELWCQCSPGEVSAYHHPDNGRSKGHN